MDANTVHGPPLQARVVAANRAVLANLRGDPGAHGNEQGAGKCKTERGKKNDEGSRHGMAKVSRQGMAKQGRCRQTQPADELAGTGLEVNSWQTIRPAQALQQNSQPMKLASLCLAVEVGGGSAV